MNRCFGWQFVSFVLVSLFTACGPEPAIELAPGEIPGNFDARTRHNAAVHHLPGHLQIAALDVRFPHALATFDRSTGATRTLMSPTDALTGPTSGDELQVVRAFLQENLESLGLEADDIAGQELSDRVVSRYSGTTHLYFTQTHLGIPVYNGQLHLNVRRDGSILGVQNGYLPGLADAANTDAPVLSATQAVARAARALGLDDSAPRLVRAAPGIRRSSVVSAPAASLKPVEASLMWLPIRLGDARLVWRFQLHTVDDEHAYDLTVDAVTGKLWTRVDWASGDSYRVYPHPVESPIHAAQVPPADGRQLVVDPADATASPLGWHDTGTTSFTTMRGNNAHAYVDSNNSNSPPAVEPSCGASRNCDFAIDFASAPGTYQSAAVANLFYWTNLVHDTQYLVGFDEAAGNFQVNNFGNGGLGDDAVQVEAQDGGSTNNGNFKVEPDGTQSRMQMYVWTLTNPHRDGALDAGIVVHEYGHGISNRQIGGPSNVSCLGNLQTGNEGWSDWLALVYTARPGDTGATGRGLGTYALGQAADGPGLRSQRYSTDPSVNDFTYESIIGKTSKYAVGEVWAQALWEVYWALVDAHGFTSDLQDTSSTAGNRRALLYVNEGFKHTKCSPTFVDARDGIIQAAMSNFGGEDVCRIWEAFAAFGLGTDAVAGGPETTAVTNGFSVPAECSCTPAPVANAGPDQTICPGESVTIGTAAAPNTTYSWSPGGATTAQTTVSPASTTTYTVTATTSCGSAVDTVTVVVQGDAAGLSEDFEGGGAGWVTSGLWHASASSTCASPGHSSPVAAMYYGQESSCDYATGSRTTGALVSPEITDITAASTLTFEMYRVVESFAGGAYDNAEVHVLTGGGSTSTTIWARSSQNASAAAWESSGPLSLASFAGQTIQVRFHFDSVDAVSNDHTGWFVDDVVVTGASACGP